MSKIHVFVYQKNSDLHCLSAFEAIKQFMEVSELVKLRRYVHWEIDYSGQLESNELIELITSNSYYLLNSNKEGYYLNSIPIKSDLKFHTLVDVSDKLNLDENEIINKIESKCQVAIDCLKKSIVWDIQLSQNISQDSVDFIETNLLNSVSLEKGILVNPIFETYSFLNKAQFLKN